MQIELYLTPFPLHRADLEGKAVVVIDVLRASTSICASLNSGARGVIPASGPGEAAELWSKLGPENAILAGERGGIKIDNFQLGNSPGEFTEDTVGDKLVILTTTNGSAVFGRTAKARLVYCAAIVNATTVANSLANETGTIVIICSGQEGGFSIEDTLCGGMLIDRLADLTGTTPAMNDAASLARLLFRENQDKLPQTIAQGEHARYLASIGFARDVELSSQVDALPVLPVLNDGRLVKQEVG